MQPVGLRNLHYALLTEDSEDALTYGTPQPLSGAGSTGSGARAPRPSGGRAGEARDRARHALPTGT